MTSDIEVAENVMRAFKALKFFPSDPEAQNAIMATVMRICKTQKQMLQLLDEVYLEWPEWEGPAALRQLALRLWPATPAPPLRYEVVSGVDCDGNAREGVRLLSGTESRLAITPAEDAATVRAECTALIRQITAPRLTALDIKPLPPDANCAICYGSGWRIVDQLRCACTSRRRTQPKPIQMPTASELEAEFLAARPDMQIAEKDGILLSKPPALSQADLELKAEAVEAKRSLQERAAEVAALEAELEKSGYQHPNRSGRHREVVLGTERFLVQ